MHVTGHPDWDTYIEGPWIRHWLTSHTSACDVMGMLQRRGDGRLYCFAID